MIKRIEYIDFLKFFAIFCVVLGHMLQYGYDYDGNEFYNNRLWAFIYSFHMPLFMMLSGFFATSSLQSSFYNMVKKKIIRIWLPAYIWLSIALLVCMIICCFTEWEIKEIPNFFPPFYNVFWYLNCLIFCYTIIFIAKKIIKRDLFAFVSSCILFICLPIGYIDNINFMLPYFWIGYFLHKYDYWVILHLHYILFTSFLCFLILSLFWAGRFTVYKYPIILFPLPTINYLSILCYRYTIGLMGALFFWTLAIFTIRMTKYSYLSLITRCGKYTLVIYIFNILCCELYSRSPLHIYNYKGNIMHYNLLSIILAILFIIFSLIVISIFQRNVFTRNYLLGKS